MENRQNDDGGRGQKAARPKLPIESQRRRFPADENPGDDAMQLESLRDLFVRELEDVYEAERQILKALPMIEAVEKAR